ncbi:site-specific integrase [Streptomyces galilaeus]|uniref:tyrosine-type recombinase/integrase n=1 Tax=Streptomyces galilaeus TaxID=33899 RepID=UPI00123DDAA2|nr:site-specific integrase [Streptomyces galilaeus]QEU67272.1 site-specific integrase [Streptomyces galilaeus]GGW45354.1 integrase [Streptomyces galilaeus]
MTTITVTADAALRTPPPATLRGLEIAALIQTFSPRPTPTTWPATQAPRAAVLERLQQHPFATGRGSTHTARMVGVRLILGWLETFPGETWQERWEASPAATAYKGWADSLVTWGHANGRKPGFPTIAAGMLVLTCADIIRPGLHWLTKNPSGNLRPAMAATRDPDGFTQLEMSVPARELTTSTGSKALRVISQILAAKGGRVEDIIVGDLLEMVQATNRHASPAVRLAYKWLLDRGQFPPDAPSTLNHVKSRAGQVGPAGLVDRYHLRCKPIRDLIVAYLTERQPALDYNSLKLLSHHLACLFWADLELHHPGIQDLRLPPEVSDAWKARLAVRTVRKRLPDGTVSEATTPRTSAPSVKTTVRAFYLDIAQWALDEPERWGAWVAPSPVSEAEGSGKKTEQEQKARADQRTRERLPVLPTLVRTAERRLKEAKARLDAVDAAPLGSTVTVLGERFILPRTTNRPDGRPGLVRDANGDPRNLRAEERIAFIAWATIEILRHTGIRVEELLEIGHHSIISYKLPSTGEIVPLLQIAPSKTDKERLLLINPELADALSAVISRVRQPDGSIPSIPVYDMHEKVWNEPRPVLYQWAVSGENRPISNNSIRKALNETLAASGLLDKEGKPLHFQPHDFRRIFITDAILNGLPPHIAQIIAGHDSINTTMGYAAIYPTDAIEAHRSFIARRRKIRPSEEYRTVTPEEWEEFLGHFERRKLALGTCGRAYGTDCAHEHACIRCPVLITDITDRPRMVEIHDNLADRIEEAEREGWLGEVEGLSVSRAAAEEKIAQLDARQDRKESPVFLGIPAFEQIVARTSQANPG